MELCRDLYGDRSYQYAHCCFLRAKTLMMLDGSDPAETKKAIEEAIDIEEEL